VEKKVSLIVSIVFIFLWTQTILHQLSAQELMVGDFRVMSFNIRNSHARDEDHNKWPNRKELVYEVIRKYAPDILGLQEVNRFQLDDIKQIFPEYENVGMGSKGESNGQFSSIHYSKKRFSKKESGDFWLSETPSELSKDWGSAHHRICTWVALFDKETQKIIYSYNTHLDDGSRKAREKSAQLIMKHIHKHARTNPFIVMGDFNAPEDSTLLNYISGRSKLTSHPHLHAVDSFRILHPKTKDVGTYNGFIGKSNGPKIDYIMVKPDIEVIEASILKSNRKGRYPSDHFPVTAQLRIKN
jgi:endonuclease/exonuclease/phosphatase family metal-dependent hydrolase